MRDEAALLPACLAALARQQDAEGMAVLLLLNDCHDDSAAIARAMAPALPFPLDIQEHCLPPGARHVGEARGRALDAAAAWLERHGATDGLLLTTDADSTVAPDWLSRSRAALGGGVQAVAGHVAYAQASAAELPPGLAYRIQQEAHYAALLAELDARIDAEPHDPWPRHRMASGASLALTLGAYRRIGGLPRLPVGEDRALVAALLAAGIPLRHALDVRVTTSCRQLGRAPGGAAATLQGWLAQPETAGDPLLETPLALLHRAGLRRQARQAQAAGDLHRLDQLLGLPALVLARLQPLPFTAAWHGIAAQSPWLLPQGLPPQQLPWAIALAEALLEPHAGALPQQAPALCQTA